MRDNADPILNADPMPSLGIEDLTPRQMQIFDLLEEGYCNKEIAYRIGITEATIKCHIGKIMRRTGCRNRTQLALLSLRLKHGLQPPAHLTNT
jgi:DNA-binding NarL/FixJ family response regulator